MPKSKIAVTIDTEIIRQVDHLVREHTHPSRSRIIEEALAEKLARLDRDRLPRELEKLDPKFERALAEEGLTQDRARWPEY